MARAGFKGQRTDEPKPEGASDAIFRTMEGQDRVEGDFSEEARSRSLSTWLPCEPDPCADPGQILGYELR